ncbi:helix-turn-helix domain-containing protein [Pedobacter aquatilis]|uniref:AraC family transcriptional regulator n=1 Tax=Pedobacter aquatilis TaxID=351343 RepID=UPI00292CC959|nr:helix-turn-helix domain-containing protein [Pedobacter aquatilis]
MLSIVFFTRFGQILNSIVITAGHEQILAVLFQILTPLYFAAPACFYLYVTGVLTDRKGITKTQWLHFLPALLAIIHVIPWPGVPQLDWSLISDQLAKNGYLTLTARNGLFPGYFHNLGRTALMLLYLFLCWRAVLKSGIIKTYKQEDLGRDWVLFILGVASLFQIIGLSPIIYLSLNIPLNHTSFIIFNCVALLLILSYALHKPKLFYGYLLVATTWEGKSYLVPTITDEPIVIQEAAPIEEQVSPNKKRNNLSDEQLSSYSLLITKAMEEEQLYLKSDLQIIDLATKLNIPVHHCSYVLNKQIGKNFRDWINAYRVEYFLKAYPLKGSRMTIEAIAQESGFKNLATFYNAFKKEKGSLPSSYFNQEP